MSGQALEAARLAVARGWRPFPLDHPALPTCIGLHGPRSTCNGKRGKHPVVKFGTATAIEVPDATLAMWFNGEARNIGIACKPSGLLVIDEDVPDALTALAASLGECLPTTYRVRTRRGWHWYFQAPVGVELGNSAGALAPAGMDVRGGGGEHGGYVVGEGSVHECGLVYEAEDWQVLPAPLPEWLIDQIRGGAESSARSALPHGKSTGRLRKARPHSDYPDGWDDLPRTGTADELVAQYRRHLDAVRTPGGEFRHELYLAALDGWRLVDCGQLTEGALSSELTTAVERVWHAPPDERDRHIIDVEARDKAATSPWSVVAESGDGGSGQGEGSSEDSPTPLALAFAAEKRKETIRRAVRAELAAEALPDPCRLAGNAFLTVPRPAPLVPGLLYRDSLAHVYGADGSGKSLFVLDVALSLATGRSWTAKHVEESGPEGTGQPVHFVMAEGSAVNVVRADAWMRYHGISTLPEEFVAFPTAVSLTPVGITRYLDHIRADRPVLIALDTKNAMMEGNESDPSDVAELVRAMHALRAVCGSCVWLVDHTGVKDQDRARGSTALKAATDTQHRVHKDPDTAIVSVWREARRNDIAGLVGEFRLRAVDPAVVCTPLTEQDRAIPFAAGEGWWRHAPELIPDEIAELDGKGRAAARDIFRVLAYVNERDGLTVAQLQAIVGEGPRAHARSTFFAGLAQLKEEGVLVTGSTPARLALADRFSPPPGEGGAT